MNSRGTLNLPIHFFTFTCRKALIAHSEYQKYMTSS